MLVSSGGGGGGLHKVDRFEELLEVDRLAVFGLDGKSLKNPRTGGTYNMMRTKLMDRTNAITIAVSEAQPQKFWLHPFPPSNTEKRVRWPDLPVTISVPFASTSLVRHSSSHTHLWRDSE